MNAFRNYGASIGLIFLPLLLLADVLVPAPARAGAPIKADEIVMRDGTVLRGLIVRQTSRDVTLQLPYAEKEISKQDIVRIRNVGDGDLVYKTVPPPGRLPPWRIIANDLRNEDRIREFLQIPATVIDEGVFHNVPYLSFRANRFVELNVYGDPDNPAGIEIGFYGPRRDDREAWRFGRLFLASYLTGVDEISALYELEPAGGILQAGDLTLEATPPDAPDAYGARWISIYNKKQLDRQRMSSAEYAELTLPAERVVLPDGSVAPESWENHEMRRSRRFQSGEDDRVFARGFYRDAQGRFQLLTTDGAGN